MWTLTQTDDTLWYHVYENQDGQKMGGDRKRRAGASLQEGNTSRKRLKEALMMKEEEEEVAVNSVQDTEEEEEMLRDYFQLNVELGALYKEWKAVDPHFKKVADIFTGKVQSKSYNAVMIQLLNYYLYYVSKICTWCFSGVRMLRQDPTECLFSFICTSNNHISRIQGMVERLCQALGAPLCQLDQTPYHDFPSLAALAGLLFFSYRP